MIVITDVEAGIISQALKILESKMAQGPKLTSPSMVREYLKLKVGGNHNEVFGVVLLDTQHNVLGLKELFYGSVDACSVYPRVLVQQVIAANASAVILFHNHPSGCVDPSSADKSITRKLVDALSLVDVRVLDHFVIGKTETFSFAENGLL